MCLDIVGIETSGPYNSYASNRNWFNDNCGFPKSMSRHIPFHTRNHRLSDLSRIVDFDFESKGIVRVIVLIVYIRRIDCDHHAIVIVGAVFTKPPKQRFEVRKNKVHWQFGYIAGLP